MINIKIDQIIRSKRKTLGVEVTHDARLIVRAPKTASLAYIEKVVSKKQLWIQSKQKLVTEKQQLVQPKEFISGEGFLYLGDTYQLHIVDDCSPSLSFDQGFYLLSSVLNEKSPQVLFIDWYRKQAYQKIKERIDWYSDLFGFKYNKFSITNAQKRWGSCNTKGNLYISWRLIMAPLHVVDYVVIHELTHLKEMNHSKKFWDKIRVMIPDFQKSLNWLKENGHLLVI